MTEAEPPGRWVGVGGAVACDECVRESPLGFNWVFGLETAS